MPGEPVLAVDDLKTIFLTRYGVIRAVNGVSFALEPGKTLGLVGESGCGKNRYIPFAARPYLVGGHAPLNDAGSSY